MNRDDANKQTARRAAARKGAATRARQRHAADLYERQRDELYERQRPVLVVIRHPDAETALAWFGMDEPRTVVLDLGSSFDAARLGEADRESVAEWAESHRDEANTLREDARQEIRSQVREIVAERRSWNDAGSRSGQPVRR